MAWHSKRHNIKHRKAAQDQKKWKIAAVLGKAIQMAARHWDDPSMNPSLDLAIRKAKSAGVSKDVIQRAVDKWSGKLEGEDLQEIFYEGYGAGGVALYIKAVTDNTNRSNASIKTIVEKAGWSMGTPWSVSRQFTEKGEIVIDGTIEIVTEKWNEVENYHPLDEEAFEMDVLDSWAEDYEIQEWVAIVTTSKEDYIGATKFFGDKSYKIDDANLQFMPENTIAVDDTIREKVEKLIASLEEDDDVETVWTNMEE